MSVSVPDPEEVLFVPVSAVEIYPLTFVCGPAVVAVMFTVIVQVTAVDPVRAGRVPLVRLTVVAPGSAEKAPPQPLTTTGDAATCSPSGRSSVKPAEVRAMLFSLVSVKVRVDVPPTEIGSGENAFESVGCCGTPHPVTMMSSMYATASGLPTLRPRGINRKYVVVAPVAAAVPV